MRQFILITIMWAFASLGHAQTHVKKIIDNILVEHPEWIVNFGSRETNGTSPQANRTYQLLMTDSAAIDMLLSAFEMDKVSGYSYIRTSAAYNQATQMHRRSTVTLQNGEKLDSHSTEYSFVSLSAIDPKRPTFRTNYILKWYLPKNGRTEAQIYILYGPRPNNKYNT